MQISYRQYPYPVLNFYENNYIKSKFETEINQSSNNGKISLHFKFYLQCASLKRLIEKDQATYLIHLECRNTRYRQVFMSTEENLNIILDSADINFEIEICSMIVAKQDIKNYYSEDFIEDFKEDTFYIEKGSILGVDKSCNIIVEKEGDGFKNVASIFSIMKKETLEKGIEWSDEGEKILIALSKEKYAIYKSLKNHRKYASMLSIMIVIPILVEIIQDLKINAESEELSKCVNIIYMKIIDLKINIHAENASTIAYKLLDGAIEECFNCIKDMSEGEY